MNNFKLNSNYGHIQFGFFYIGWNNNPYTSTKYNDCGDETFGFAVGNFYVGCYSGDGWCAGILNENGCLDD